MYMPEENNMWAAGVIEAPQSLPFYSDPVLEATRAMQDRYLEIKEAGLPVHFECYLAVVSEKTKTNP